MFTDMCSLGQMMVFCRYQSQTMDYYTWYVFLIKAMASLEHISIHVKFNSDDSFQTLVKLCNR